MNIQSNYCCTEKSCNHARLIAKPEGLYCPGGHYFEFVKNTNVPIFARESENANEYTRENASQIHDNALKWVFATFMHDEDSFRMKLVSRLKLKAGHKVLITGAGAGNDISYIVRLLDGQGEIYAQDIAQEMLLSAVARYQDESNKTGISLHFSVSDATNLPFADDYFDAAYHFGGINLFPDIRTGINEMNRVVKPGGIVLIGDEGVAPWLKSTEFGRMLIKNNPLYACDIPLGFLPESATSVNLSWELSNCFYVITFEVAIDHPPLDINVPHIGVRGGTIRTRYFGQLEGVDPELRDRIFLVAKQKGLSRVEFLESLLRSGLSGN